MQPCMSVLLIKLLIMSGDTGTRYGFVLLWMLLGGQAVGCRSRKDTLPASTSQPTHLLLSSPQRCAAHYSATENKGLHYYTKDCWFLSYRMSLTYSKTRFVLLISSGVTLPSWYDMTSASAQLSHSAGKHFLAYISFLTVMDL